MPGPDLKRGVFLWSKGGGSLEPGQKVGVAAYRVGDREWLTAAGEELFQFSRGLVFQEVAQECGRRTPTTLAGASIVDVKNAIAACLQKDAGQTSWRAWVAKDSQTRPDYYYAAVCIDAHNKQKDQP
jgi:hypothetical protein